MKGFSNLRSCLLPRRASRKRTDNRGLGQRGLRVESLEGRLMLASVTFSTPSTNGGDGTWVADQREGTAVVVGPAYLYYNLNPFAAFPGFAQGDSLHVKVDYYDEGSGTLRVQYDSLAANFDNTEFHTRSSRIDTQEFVTSYHYLTDVEFADGANGNDFRVAAFGAPVASVTLSDEPFADSGLEWAWSPPWEAPYSGLSRPVDASTLNGKVLAGYQGWFNTPNDATDRGYFHWGEPGDWSIDQWPDPNDYDASELFTVPGVTTASGEQAYLFSSANDSVVDRHFQWMREHDIDGVFVQRFRPSFMYKDNAGNYSGEPQWPVVNARDAAHRSGRTWAIEYDIQNGGSPAERDQVIQDVKDDWEYLTDPNRMDMLNDSHYQHEQGKPVVAIFGLYIGSDNQYSTAQQTELVSWFQSRGVYVIGAGRHQQSGSQIANAGLHDAYIPWQGYNWGGQSYTPSENALNGVVEHIPHVFPGFSWTHLRDSSSATSVDREDGEFYWRMLSDAINETNAPWLFLGMFDEYDEATNVIPASDDPPAPDTDPQGNDLTFQVSDPRPNDWWMALTGAARQALQGKATINDTMPTEASLENRSNVGGEARWEVAATDRLVSVPTADSDVEIVQVPVQGITSSAIRSSDPYLYFSVGDDFLSADENGRDVTIEVEYLDLTAGQFSLDYDGLSSAYTPGGAALLTGSGEWRTHRFEVSDAYFANRQNGDADLRLVKAGGNLFVRRVSVLKEAVLSVEADLGLVNTSQGLEQAELPGDGQTGVVNSGGREARLLNGNPESLYIYFRIDDGFASEVHAGLNAIVEVVYQDVGVGDLKIQYDATGAAYENSNSVQLGGTNEWRTARFYLDDAFFGNRQNGSADFRVVGSNIPIDQVRVLKSFGDLIEPELAVGSAVVDSPNSTVMLPIAFADDWQSGLHDKWVEQEDNQIAVELSGDGGITWQPLEVAYENSSSTAVSMFDQATGVHEWIDALILSTEQLASGSYQLRLTPTDGRENTGEAIVTPAFQVYAPPALPGDYNGDGSVDAADYTTWRDIVGAQVTPYTSADGDGNGIVDAADRDIWASNYGASQPPSTALSLVISEQDAPKSLILSEDDLQRIAFDAGASASHSEVVDRLLAIDLALLSNASVEGDAELGEARRISLTQSAGTRDLLLIQSGFAGFESEPGDVHASDEALAVTDPTDGELEALGKAVPSRNSRVFEQLR